jgi:uncharacterized protein YbjQ (UPF0145 family)
MTSPFSRDPGEARRPVPGHPGTIALEWVTTGLTFEGQRITRHCGVVRGIVVRSRSIVGNIGAAFQTLFGGNITLYTQLCEHARQDAFDLMCRHAAAVGANAIVAMRYDANEVASGVTEVLAYGTAVVIQPE